nr:PREDICTED: A-kinase anchor protein 9-like isoform X1 [Latimeria chalumnae]|eukprot:XP_014340656.1 PREDICTED: A-kinase anchor protein 9-like isoform X1 [Latimeria chalumnae]
MSSFHLITTGTLSRCLSVSKDTGLGSTSTPGELPFSDTELIYSSRLETADTSENREMNEGARTQKEDATSVEEHGEEDKDSRREQYKWRLTQLLGSEQAENPGYHSDSNTAESVCTEDFAAKFKEEMVNPALNSDEELDSDDACIGKPVVDADSHKRDLLPKEDLRKCEDGIFASTSLLIEECSIAADNTVLNIARREDIILQFRHELEADLEVTLSSADEKVDSGVLNTKSRTESVESLGDKISKLSQNNTSESQCTPGRSISVEGLSDERWMEGSVELQKESVFPANSCLLSKGFGTGHIGPSIVSLEKQHSISNFPSSTKGFNKDLSSDQGKPTSVASVGHSKTVSLASSVHFSVDPKDSYKGMLSENCSASQKILNGTGPLLLETDNQPEQSVSCFFKKRESLKESGLSPPSELKVRSLGESSKPTQIPQRSLTLHGSPEAISHSIGKSLSSLQEGRLEVKPSAVSSSNVINQTESLKKETVNLFPHCRSISPSRQAGRGVTSDIDKNYKKEFESCLKEQQLFDIRNPVHNSRSNLRKGPGGTFGSQTSLNTVMTEEYVDTFHTMMVKHVAGIPVTSFDEVTIDSDLDSVKTERVRTHFQKAISSRNDIASVKSSTADDFYTDQSDLDSAKVEQIERKFHDTLRKKKNALHGGRSLSIPAPSGSRIPKRSRSARKEPFRCTDTARVITDEEEDLEEHFVDSGKEWSSSSPLRWSSSPKRVAECAWEWSESTPQKHSPSMQRLRQRPLVEQLGSDRVILEESIARLRRDLAAEENWLSQKKSQLREADASLSDTLQQKKQALKELDSLKAAIEKSQKDLKSIESQLREGQSKADESRTELVLLGYKRDSCLKEFQDLTEELSVLRRQCSATQNSQMGILQNEISSLVEERDKLRACLRQAEGSVSFLERQELERQLNCTKNELFSEQRSARVRIEELQELLEESQIKLHEKTEEVTGLWEKTNHLELRLKELERIKAAEAETHALKITKTNQSFNKEIQELSLLVSERDMKISALERILSEKELELLKLRETGSSLRSEKEAALVAMETLKQEHAGHLAQLKLEKQREKDHELMALREDLLHLKEKELQQFEEKMEEIRVQALKDQASSFMQETEKLVVRIQDKEEEISKLKEKLNSQQESMRKLTEELKLEAKEMVQSALIREQRKWEAAKEDELLEQRGVLEDESQRAMAGVREELEKERRNSLALQKKIVDLQSEQSQEAEGLKLKLCQLEEELQLLRAERNEVAMKEREAQLQVERAERSIALDIRSECEQLQDLIQYRRSGNEAMSPTRTKLGSPSRMTMKQALQILQRVSQELQQYILDLRQELESQQRAIHHVQRDKERELKQQQDQLCLEKEEALDCLKQQLIQEHIEEISNLLKDSGSSEVQPLRQQLREKDNELRAIQRNMTKWKDETASKLACKFEEELNAELEKRLSRNRSSDHQRKMEKLESEVRRLSMETVETSHLRCASSPSLDAVSSPGHHDFGTLKLLRHLQSRVKQLRAENSIYQGGSMENLSSLAGELGDSYREMSRVMPNRPRFLGQSGRKYAKEL